MAALVAVAFELASGLGVTSTEGNAVEGGADWGAQVAAVQTKPSQASDLAPFITQLVWHEGIECKSRAHQASDVYLVDERFAAPQGSSARVATMLHAMKSEATSDTVIEGGLLDDLDHLAQPFRDALVVADLDRPELHEAEATSSPIVFYGCRHTGITWRAVRGDSPIHIRRDAGHESFRTTEGYIRTASPFVGREASFGVPFSAAAFVLAGEPS